MTQQAAEIRHVVDRTGFANPLTLGVLVEDVDYLKVYADLELLQVGVDYTVTGIGDANGVSIEIIGGEDVDEYVGVEEFTALYDPVLQQGADFSLGGNFGRAFESALDAQNRQLQAVAERAYAVDANTLSAALSAEAAELAADAAEDAAAIAIAGAGTTIFSSVAQAQAYSPSVAPDFIKTAGYTSAGDGGGALYVKVASEPSHAGKFSITLSGGGVAWFELTGTVVTLEMFGGKADCVYSLGSGTTGSLTGTPTDNLAAFDAAQAYLSSNPITFYEGGAVIAVQAGCYYFSGTINIKKTLQVIFPNGFQNGGWASEWVFPADTFGVIVNRYNTLDDGLESPTTTGGDGSVLEYPRLVSLGGTDRTKCGLWLRARAKVVGCNITNFPGDGLRLQADSGGGASTMGNCNNSEIIGGRVTRCHVGLYANGADANQCYVEHFDASSNRTWGIHDNSFLGNQYVACHTAANGSRITADDCAAQVSYGGNRYYVINAATAAAITPGTDATVWGLMGAGAVSTVFVDWSTFAGTYVVGGAYANDNANSRAMFIGCYSENGQPPSKVDTPAQIIGGLHAAGDRGTGFDLRNNVVTGQMSVRARSATQEIILEPSTSRAFTLRADGDSSTGLVMQWDSSVGQWQWRHAGLGARTPYRITTDLNTSQGGRSVVIGPGNVIFAQGIWLGASIANSRHVTNGTAAPTTGDWAEGDIVINRVPASGQPMWWGCSVAGSPGTWLPGANYP